MTVNGRTFTYEEGGSLGKIEITATYRSANFQNLTIPIVQQAALIFPAVPVVVIQNTAASTDTSNPLKPLPLFCEGDGEINISGFPAPQRGSSTGTFTVVDELTGAPLVASAYRDNQNGTLSLFSTVARNGYQSILVTYVYQQNGVPCASVASQRLRIAPNPVADFSFSKLCEDTPVQFTDLSTVDAASGSVISTWSWEFADPNSNANTSSAQNPQHVYAQPGLYTRVFTK